MPSIDNENEELNIFNLPLPGLFTEQKITLKTLLHNFFTNTNGPYYTLQKTSAIHQALSKQLTHFFINNKITLPNDFYAANNNLNPFLNEKLGNERKNYISFALKNAISCVYNIPLLSALKSTTCLKTSEIFALQQLENTLAKTRDKKKLYATIKKSLLRHDEVSQPFTERLDLVYFSSYQDRLNEIAPGKLPQVKQLCNYMQQDLEHTFENLLQNRFITFPGIMRSFRTSLYFDKQSETQCKNSFFQFLFNHSEKTFNFITPPDERNARAKLMLDCIRDQLQQYPQTYQPKLRQLLKEAREQPEKSLDYLHNIIMLTKALIYSHGFFIFWKSKHAHDKFLLQINQLEPVVSLIAPKLSSQRNRSY